MVRKNKEKRSAVRNRIIGDIWWSYAFHTGLPRYKGTTLDFSGSGLSIFTVKPIMEGVRLKICCKGLWEGDKYATVKWSRRVDQRTYRAGLLIQHR
jgi:hypothetical protein